MAVTKTRQWREKRGAWFSDAIMAADDSDRRQLLSKVAECRELYFMEAGGFDTSVEDGPWENAADLHIPIITEKIETATPKVMSAMWRANPFVNVKRPGGSDFSQEKTKNMENFLSWAFRNDIPNFYLVFENFLRNMFIDGTSFAKIRWERKMRRAIETHIVEAYDITAEGQLLRPYSDILAEVFGLGDVDQTLYDTQQTGEGKFDVKFTEHGRQFKGRVEFLQTERMDKVKVRVFRNIIENESPVIDLVEIEDLVFPFRAPTLQQADWVAHRTWYSYNEIEDLVKNGAWSLTKDQLKRLKGGAKLADETNEHESLKDRKTGVEGNTGQHLRSEDGQLDPNKIMVWEVYTEDYADEGDLPINVVYFMPDGLRTIAGMEYHDEVFPHGKRPFVSATYIPIAGRVYGIGIAELLYGVNLSIDHTINSVHNNMSITTNPMFFYSPMSMAQNGNSLLSVKPGQGVPVMNPRDVFFPQFGQQPLEQYHATYNQMKGIADSLTFSPAVGGNSNYRNAPRTARGTMALMDAAEEKLSTIVEQLQAGAWKHMIEQVSSLYGAYLTIDKWYYITGETEARHISPKELRQNFVFEFSGSLTSVNRDYQRTLSQQLFMMLNTEPAYQNDPEAKNNLLRYIATQFGEGLDVESILPAPPGTKGFKHPAMTQEMENRQLAQGEPVQVLPIDDDNEHLGVLRAFTESEAFMVLPEFAKGVIYAHGKEHEMQQQQKLAQQQRTANTQGTGAAFQGAQDLDVASPGLPSEGQPAVGGELSGLGGVT